MWNQSMSWKKTGSLYLVLAEKELTLCIQNKMEAECEKFRLSESDDNFGADTLGSFSQICYPKHTNLDKGEPGLLRVECQSSKKLWFCCKSYSFYDTVSKRLQISIKGLKKRRLQQGGDRSLEKYGKVFKDALRSVTKTDLFEKKRCNIWAD